MNHQDEAVRRRLIQNGVGLLLYLLSTAYLAWHGYALFSVVMPAALYAPLISFFSLVAPLVALAFDQGQEKDHHLKSVAYVGFYWLGFYVYTLAMLVAFDLVRLMSRATGLQAYLYERGLGLDMPRHWGIAAIFWLSLLLLLIGTFLARCPKIHKRSVQLEKPLSRPLRIAFVSDLHVGSLVSTSNLEAMVDRLNRQEPDLVLLGGDLIDNALSLIRDEDFGAPLRRLRARCGVFAVLGNHELVNTDAKAMRQFLAKANVRLLQDESLDLEGLTLVGRDEHQTHYSAKLDRMLPQDLLASAHRQKPILLMQHQPLDIAEFASLGVDIALAGHTHRGQMFPLGLLQKKQYSQTKRFARIGKLSSMVSAGLGTWGPPVRLGSRSEMILLEIDGL